MREILFGVVYLPQITCVEDFSPYWTTDNWTPRRMLTDLKIMKAVGCSCVRFHLYPAIPGKFEFPGVEPEKFIPMLDLATEAAAELGLRVHLDLLQDEDDAGKEAIRDYVTRYRSKIDSYQIGNERWDIADNPDRLRWLQDVIELVHGVDPQATVSTDLLVPAWVKIRDEMPDLYRALDVGYVHYYSLTDYRGWNDLYIADLIDHLSNKTGRKSVTEISNVDLTSSGDFDASSQSYDHPFYAGSWAWLDKELWITELSSHGYWRWGNLVPEDKRAADWRRVIDAIAESDNAVTRVYHHCFRNKMGWREFGRDQSGLVRYDGAPRPATAAFREVAAKYAPADSPLRILRCDIRRVEAPLGADSVELVIRVANLTCAPLGSSAVLDLPEGASSEESAFSFSLPAGGEVIHKQRIAVSNLPWGNNHVFARVQTPNGPAFGWGVVARPKRVELDGTPSIIAELPARVSYVHGLQAVQEFFDAYSDECAVLHGRALGIEAEMGYRLKIIIEAMRCREVPIRAAIMPTDVLNRPLIVVGSPEFNLISRVIEMKLPERERVHAANPGRGMGLINVVESPFGKMSAESRSSPQSEAIGYYFGGCPAALYVAGSDDDGLLAAAYDLILRIWGRDCKYC